MVHGLDKKQHLLQTPSLCWKAHVDQLLHAQLVRVRVRPAAPILLITKYPRVSTAEYGPVSWYYGVPSISPTAAIAHHSTVGAGQAPRGTPGSSLQYYGSRAGMVRGSCQLSSFAEDPWPF